MTSGWSANAPVFSKEAANPRRRPDKRRRNLLVLAGVVVAVAVGAAALTYSHWNPRQTSGTTVSAQTHLAPSGVTKCLTARGALVFPRSARNVIRVFPTAPAVRVSFVPHPFNDGILFFEPSHAKAQTAAATLAARARGHVSAAQFNRDVQIRNNVVVIWLTNPKMASATRSAVLGCLS